MSWKSPGGEQRVLVITSCTGEKAVQSEHSLTKEDFLRGKNHVAARERELECELMSAGTIYTGEQHTRLMRGWKCRTIYCRCERRCSTTNFERPLLAGIQGCEPIRRRTWRRRLRSPRFEMLSFQEPMRRRS